MRRERHPSAASDVPVAAPQNGEVKPVVSRQLGAGHRMQDRLGRRSLSDPSLTRICSHLSGALLRSKER